MSKRFLPALLEEFSEPWPATSMNRIMRNMMDNMSGMSPLFDGDDMCLAPRVDFYRKDGKLYVEAELPGIDPGEVDLHVYRDRLVLSAEKKSEQKEKKDRQGYIRSERYYGKFERVVVFPVEVNADNAKATFKNGVLTVELVENTKPEDYTKVKITPVN